MKEIFTRLSGASSLRGILVLLAVAVCFPPTGVFAQSNILDLRLLEVDDGGDRTYHNVIYSHSFGDSRFSLEAFYLFLPQFDDYEEPGLGVGYKALSLGDVEVSLIGYLASAPDDDYFEPAVLVIDGAGRWTWSVFLLRYLPLSSAGIEQWLVDPAEIQVRVKGPLSVGLSAYLYRPQGGDWLRKVGPKISVEDRLGATEIALRDVNQGGGYELQLRRILLF